MRVKILGLLAVWMPTWLIASKSAPFVLHRPDRGCTDARRHSVLDKHVRGENHERLDC